MNGFLKLTGVMLIVAGYSLPVKASNVPGKIQMTTLAAISQTTIINEPPVPDLSEHTVLKAENQPSIVNSKSSLPANVIGKNAEFYRINKGAKGVYFIIQDFYISGEKRTDPYLVTDLDKVTNNDFDLLDYDRFPINGLLIVWFKNGLIQQKGVFNHECKRKGLWVSWYDNGQKKTSGRYLNNLKEGPWTNWYDNGRRMQKGYYQQDAKEGVWIYWYGNGKKKEAGRYNQDQRVERWSSWDDAGNMINQKEIKPSEESVNTEN